MNIIPVGGVRVRTLEEFEVYVENEARQEGAAALADLAAQRQRFRLARELSALRKERKLTQVQLSQRSGVPQSEISKIESASINPSEVTLLRLLAPLGCTLGIVRMPSEARMRGTARQKTPPRSKPVVARAASVKRR
jgi:DNA-binding XRE family transcriptional regulator